MGNKEADSVLMLDKEFNGMMFGVNALLRGIGQDPTREGLQDTAKRHAKFLKSFCNPPNTEPGEKDFTFATFDGEGTNEMVMVSNIPFYSMCEHHLLPFFGTACIAYIPKGRLAGLSKLPRTLNWYANQPQNQERITKQVCEFLKNKLETEDVAVMLKARHMCMEMRGVKSHDAWTTTSAVFGKFREDANCRNEFIQLSKL